MNLKVILYFLVLLALLSVSYLFSQLNLAGQVNLEKKEILALRAIDGDTIESDIGKIRLLGINTPEKKFQYYQEAKEFLESYENLTLEIESRGQDKYKRTLAYLYYNNRMINTEILKRGLANLYVYEKDSNYPSLEKAEDYARKKQLGIWAQSRNAGCLKIITFNYSELTRCNNQEVLILDNLCPSLEITIKDDATHIFMFNLSNGRFQTNFSCIFNDEGDSLFIWDKSGLVLFERYA